MSRAGTWNHLRWQGCWVIDVSLYRALPETTIICSTKDVLSVISSSKRIFSLRTLCGTYFCSHLCSCRTQRPSLNSFEQTIFLLERRLDKRKASSTRLVEGLSFALRGIIPNSTHLYIVIITEDSPVNKVEIIKARLLHVCDDEADNYIPEMQRCRTWNNSLQFSRVVKRGRLLWNRCGDNGCADRLCAFTRNFHLCSEELTASMEQNKVLKLRTGTEDIL